MTAHTQIGRVLAALRTAGPAGITTGDFLAPNVLDGGKPIVRLPARVDELRKAGHIIATHREPNHTARYVLVRDAEGVTSAQRPGMAERPRQDDEGGSGNLTLLDVPPEATTRSAFDPWDGDA